MKCFQKVFCYAYFISSISVINPQLRLICTVGWEESGSHYFVWKN